jgi:hypothetical protein
LREIITFREDGDATRIMLSISREQRKQRNTQREIDRAREGNGREEGKYVDDKQEFGVREGGRVRLCSRGDMGEMKGERIGARVMERSGKSENRKLRKWGLLRVRSERGIEGDLRGW